MINVGFAGSGTIAGLHADALMEGGVGRIAGVWSRSPTNAARFAGHYDAVALNNFETLLDGPDIDAIFILSATETHADLAVRALHAGKHVLIEKPIGVTRAEVEMFSQSDQKAQ